MPTPSANAEPSCAFCAELLVGDDTIVSIRFLSRTRGQRFLGAHARCFRDVVRPEVAQLVDLSDVAPGLDHVLPLSARL